MRRAVYNILAQRSGAREGQVFSARNVRASFVNSVKKAKIDDFHFHDMRHHFASWFVMRGGSIQALKEILGHATLAMTMRYAHLAPEHLRSEITKTERPVEPRSGTRDAQDLVNAEENASNHMREHESSMLE